MDSKALQGRWGDKKLEKKEGCCVSKLVEAVGIKRELDEGIHTVRLPMH